MENKIKIRNLITNDEKNTMISLQKKSKDDKKQIKKICNKYSIKKVIKINDNLSNEQYRFFIPLEKYKNIRIVTKKKDGLFSLETVQVQNNYFIFDSSDVDCIYILKKNNFLLLILLLLVFLCGFLYFWSNKNTDIPKEDLKIDSNIDIGDIEGLSEEEIQKMLNEKVAFNYININMNTNITVFEKSITNLNLNNNGNKYDGFKYYKDKNSSLAVSCTDENNKKICINYGGEKFEVDSFEKVTLKKSLKVDIILEGETDPIFSSGLIPYGSYLKVGELNKLLDKGIHKATATISAYDENNTFLGKSNVVINLYSVDKNGSYQ